MNKLFIPLFFLVISDLCLLAWENAENHSFIQNDDYIHQMSVSEDGSYILTFQDDNILKKWNAQTGEMIWKKSISVESPDSTEFVSSFISEDALTYLNIHKYSEEKKYTARIRSIENNEIEYECTFT